MATRTARKTPERGAAPPAPVAKKRAANTTATATPSKRAPARTQDTAPRAAAPEVRRQMIEEAAYARFVARGYADGYSLIDWLEAEAEVDRRLTGG